MKRGNKINGQWSPRLIEMLESPAYRTLSVSAHRVISRIEIELAHHGGNDNGNLPVTKHDFMAYGMDHNAVAPAIREAEALGFIRMKRGRGGNAEHRQPNRFFLTFAHGRDSRASPPTHDWRKIKTIEEAKVIAEAARAAKDPHAVRFAEARKTKHQYGKPVPKPVRQTRTENATSPVRKTRTTGKGPKPVPLSISRGGGRGSRADGLAPAPSGQHQLSRQPDRRPGCELDQGFDREAAAAWVPYAERAIDHERHSRKTLMDYVANVIDEQLHDLDPVRIRARRRAQIAAREMCPFEPLGGHCPSVTARRRGAPGAPGEESDGTNRCNEIRRYYRV
jgi:hypothetical protein